MFGQGKGQFRNLFPSVRQCFQKSKIVTNHVAVDADSVVFFLCMYRGVMSHVSPTQQYTLHASRAIR